MWLLIGIPAPTYKRSKKTTRLSMKCTLWNVSRGLKRVKQEMERFQNAVDQKKPAVSGGAGIS
jgi:hypothetical protein